ncbi:protein FAM240B [Taeniopygia guttata]|uniref:protein FAM240B n=1 Tax=Taeniopygia guttata TaxID=59729 RepID=UPI0011AF8337|nr:protein FAM240B [Taeniopygia guttata]
MLPTLQIKSTEGCISLLPCDTGEATAAVAIFLVCDTQRIYLQEEYCSKEKMNSQYMRHEVRGCETSDLRNFWEKTIEQQTQYLQNEKERQRRSALTKLRNEWMERLEKRIKMLRTQSEDSSS